MGFATDWGWMTLLPIGVMILITGYDLFRLHLIRTNEKKAEKLT